MSPHKLPNFTPGQARRFAIGALIAGSSLSSLGQATFSDSSVIRNHRVLVKSGDLDSFGRPLVQIDRWVSVNTHGLVGFRGKVALSNDRLGQNIFVVNSRQSGAAYPLLRPGVAMGEATHPLEFPEVGDVPTQEFTPPVLNDNNQAITRRRINPTLFVNYLIPPGIPEQQIQYPPMTYIERYDASRTQERAQLVEGADPGVRALVTAPFHWFSHFDVFPMGSWPASIGGRPTWETALPTPFFPLGTNRWLAFQGPRNESFPTINNSGQVLFTGLGDDSQNYLSRPGLTRQGSLRTPEPRRPVAGGNFYATYYDQGPAIIKGSTTNVQSFSILEGLNTGYVNLGLSPGISEDGSAVAFAGDATIPSALRTTGPGIFLRTDRATAYRIAGTRVPYDPRSGGVFDPGVDYEDSNLNGRYDVGEPLRSMISGFHKDERICVSSRLQDGTRVYEVLFVADDSRGRKTVFRSRVNPADGRFPVTDPMPMLSVGDDIPGLGAVTDVSLFDSLTATTDSVEGQAVCWVAAGSSQAVVELRARWEPLIFVPGIGATTIIGEDGDVKWIDRGTFYDSFLGQDLREMAIGRDVEIDSVIRTISLIPWIGEQTIYGDLLDFLERKMGYRLLDLDRANRDAWVDQRERAYSAFTFPYDWRRSNAENAALLQEYVDRIVAYYREGLGSSSLNPSISIIAHSMGGLLSRRYMLDSSNHRVRTLTTIGTPFLGAAKTAQILATGDWFDVPLFGYLPPAAVREVSQDFIGAHELACSPAYFALGGRPFSEAGRDKNGNRVFYETYDSDQYVDFLDTLSVRSNPGSNAREFHQRPGQDDWRGLGLGAKYLHVVGRQATDRTIESVVAWGVVQGLPTGPNSYGFAPGESYETTVGAGDGTVPFLSASRQNGGLDLNAPGAVVTVLAGGSDYAGGDDDVEHTALCSNTATWRNGSAMIRWESVLEQSGAPGSGGAPYLQVDSVGLGDRLTMIDSLGNRSEAIGEGGVEPPGVLRTPGSVDSVTYRMPATQNYAVEFLAKEGPFTLSISRRTEEGTATRVTRFYDRVLTVGTLVRAEIAVDGSIDALYDANGDGTPETPLVASFAVSGAAAADLRAPDLSVSAVGQAFSIDASDSSGVQEVLYSLDGVTGFRYDGPVPYDPSSTAFVYAYATDRVGNRTPLVRLDLADPIRVTGMVALESYIGPPKPVTLSFMRTGSPILLAEVRVRTQPNGAFEADVVLPPGSYRVLVKTDHWLRRAVNTTANSVEMSPIQVTLINGDCTGDNVVDMLDYSFLSVSYGTERGTFAYNEGADLDGNGRVDLADYQILMAAYGLEGD